MRTFRFKPGIPPPNVPLDVIFDPSDDRGRVADASVAPFPGLCLLNAFRADGTPAALGTGFFVAPTRIVTAAHVVFDPHAFGGSGQAAKILGWPGYNAEPQPPKFFETADIVIHPIYRTTQSRDFDVAVLRLADSIGVATLFEMTVLGDRDLGGLDVRVAGYPSDKGGRELWSAHGPIRQIEAQRLFHQVDTAEGQSGAPIWFERASRPCAVGIHVHGTSLSTSVGFIANLGTRMTAGIKDWIQQSM